MNIMKGCGLLRSSHRKLAAVLVSILLILSFSSMALLVSAAENSVSLTLYNDSTSASAGSTASYTWKMTENVSNVFRLVVDMDLAQTYKAGELELTINAFDGAGRNTTITRKSFGNETGVFKETSADSSGKIVAVNTAAVNGSASISVTYQFKPEDIKDLGTVNKPLTLQCTLKAGKSTVTSNAITFSTDFTQAWSIINSGEHDEAYDWASRASKMPEHIRDLVPDGDRISDAEIAEEFVNNILPYLDDELETSEENWELKELLYI